MPLAAGRPSFDVRKLPLDSLAAPGEVTARTVERRGGGMARHNRDGYGVDQRGAEYEISYQPDWLHQIKVTRTLESGRQSTKTLFRNPGYREQSPGSKVRTRIVSPEQKLDVEVTVDDPRGLVARVTVEAVTASGEMISFTIDDQLRGRGKRG
jgi:hypothetical protein